MPYEPVMHRPSTVCSTKVLFLLPSLLRGGAEVQTIDLVNGVNPSQFEKYLITFEPSLDQKERIDTSTVQFLHCARRSKFDLSPARAIARLIDSRQIDIVHCSLTMALLMGWLAVRYSRRKPKLIVVLHTTVNRTRKDDWCDRLLFQWLMRGCQKVVCVCHAQEAYWRSKFPFLVGKTHVIYNGIDPEKFDRDRSLLAGQRLRQQLGISDQAQVITHIAGFRPEKGHTILLDAFRKVRERRPEVHLFLVGEGVLRQTIEAQVRRDGLLDNVHFLGKQEDVRPALAAADCSVVASTRVETFSVAMLESMAMKVPLVATNIGGTAEAVLDGQTGLLVNPGNVDQLAEALIAMLENDSSRTTMGSAAKALVDEKFTARHMSTQTEHLFHEVTSG